MKPRWTETSPRVGKLIEKAKELEGRIEKTQMCPDSLAIFSKSVINIFIAPSLSSPL